MILMTTHKMQCQWVDGYAFTATDEDNHQLTMDISEAAGGKNSGFKPMPLLLSGLGGCMGVDLKLILDKMRLPVTSLSIDVTGELDESRSPKTYKSIVLTFNISGDGLTQDKVKKAVDMAKTKYCNVSAILSQTADITYSINILEA